MTMENLLLVVCVILPFGLVALSAFLMLKRRLKKKPQLKVVKQDIPPEEVVERAAQALKKHISKKKPKATKKSKYFKKGKKK